VKLIASTTTGGANNDFFVFNTALNASTNRDVITDFNQREPDPGAAARRIPRRVPPRRLG